MKKYLVILILAITFCAAAKQYRQWNIVTWGNGTTAVLAAQTGKIPVIKACVGSVQNACYLYFYGNAAADKLTGDLYFGANGFLNPKPFEETIVGLSGEAINVWCSADPGGSLNLINWDYVENPS